MHDGVSVAPGFCHDLLQTAFEVAGVLAAEARCEQSIMTLAVVAHRRAPVRCNMIHAVSAAVPPQATDRVRQQARDDDWALETIDAGEFADRRYLSNPANRCFFS